jgi:ribosomal protein S18 acetylase RimI-like enzyme
MRSALAQHPARQIRVRPAALDDLDALMALEGQVFTTDRLARRSLRRLLRVGSAAVIVAETLDGMLAGAAILLFRLRSRLARLYSIAVAPPMSGQGIGARLLQAVEDVALGRSCDAIRLEVHETNHLAMSRYRKSGYREIGRYDAYYQDGGDALRFEKRFTVPSAARKGAR